MHSLNSIKIFFFILFIRQAALFNLSDENLCIGSTKTIISLNQTDSHLLELSWVYNMNDSTLTIELKHNRTDSDEFIVVLGFASSFEKNALVEKVRLNKFIYWCQDDENTEFDYKYDSNRFNIEMQIDFKSLECLSIAAFVYENNSTTSSNPIFSMQPAICNQFGNPNVSSGSKTEEKPPTVFPSLFRHQFNTNKFLPFLNFIEQRNQIYNPDFRHFMKRDLNNDSIFERKMYETRFDQGNLEGFSQANLNEFFNRIDKIMLLRTLKAARPIDEVEKRKEVTTFTMRVIKASNLTLGSLEACITNFVKHIIMKSDEKTVGSVDVEINFDNSKLSNFQRNQENKTLDLLVVIKTESKFKVSSFFETLELIAIRPNKSQNVFIYGDLSLDLDLEIQFDTEYDERMNKYESLWVIGLIVAGGVMTIVFIGCIVSICLKRRPYQRSNKIYEIEAVMRERLPKIQTMSFNVKSAEIASLQLTSQPTFK